MAVQSRDNGYDRAREAATHAGERAREGYAHARERFEHELDRHPEARRYVDYGRDYAYYGRDMTRAQVRESPLAAILVAGVAGYALAYMIHRGRRLRRGESLPEYGRYESRYRWGD